MMYLSYFGIRVNDIEKSFRFYTELFGLEEVTRGDKTRLLEEAYTYSSEIENQARTLN